MLKQDFTLEVTADNEFSILNRIINVLNRRRVRIKRLLAHEHEDVKSGKAILLLYTTSDMIEKVKHQLEKLIEVDEAVYSEGSHLFYELLERSNNKQII